jgi:hypothetical protein
MTFLKKLGELLVKGAALASGLYPLVGNFFGAKAQAVSGEVVNDLSQISQIVTTVEAVVQTPGSGAVKLAAATPLVLQILKTSQAFSGKKISDEALAEKGAAGIVQGVVDFMNAIHPDEAK